MGASSTTFSVHAACIRGVEAFSVTVEVSASGSIPGLSIVGMADAAVLEARSRIRCALRSGGFDVPRSALTVSLAPGDIRKTGSGLDLPIALAILALSGQIPLKGLDDCLFVGELGLDGSVSGCKGEIAYQVLARDQGLSFVGGSSQASVSLSGVRTGCIEHLENMRLGVEAALRPLSEGHVKPARRRPILDFGDVVGQEVAKRGIAVAATGGLGLLMVGSPGSGKSMLARRITGILPPIDEREQQEALCIHSVVGEPIEGILEGERPFRSPHHSISTPGLVGGGRPVRPGEISLAHGGVLYLDELAEFSNQTLQTLRQPLEDGSVRIVRVDGSYVFPARFQLVAASNPCPCGYLGDREIACKCSDASIERYRAKLGGPLADRIDLILHISRPDPELIVQGGEGQTTADLKEQVERGRDFCAWRTRVQSIDDEDGGDEPSLDSAVSQYQLDESGRTRLIDISHRNNLTARGIVRLCRIARTIADMAESERVGAIHVLEGAQLQGRRGNDCV
ncbi:MAG: YifB family Mg chelatase-like AAA ATPase [Coriobacteriaceae bacterium]|nr:YifB family Mg chelatase-like AAA ATPase [Coriobacteriaceae bacterium]